jgi:hypothetical protein
MESTIVAQRWYASSSMPPQYRLSRHAQDEMVRRQIPEAWVDSILTQPEQRISEAVGKEVLQSRFTAANGRMYLLRVVVATDREPPLVVTLYRTSKIEKYWRPE